LDPLRLQKLRRTLTDQIAHYIRDQILRGDLRPGWSRTRGPVKLSGPRGRGADWKVSRPTAARSLEALSHQGLVEKRQGSGTYVRSLEVNRRARELYGRARQTGKIYTPGRSRWRTGVARLRRTSRRSARSWSGTPYEQHWEGSRFGN
jgi:DNA-binding GntR family transcriptional regulator